MGSIEARQGERGTNLTFDEQTHHLVDVKTVDLVKPVVMPSDT